MTANNTNQPKGDELKLGTVQKAIRTNIPAKSNTTVGGVSYTQPQLLALITTLLAPYLAARAAQQAASTAVAAKKANEKVAKTFLVEFRAAMVALFGRSSPILAQFGFTPTKPKTLTTGQSLVKTVKAKATRQKLGTKGVKQKAAALAQQLPPFAVSTTGEVALENGAASNAPTSAPSTTSAPTGANGASTPAGSAGNGTTSGS